MKNLGTIVFLVVSFALGMFVLAAVYLGVVFGALDWLNGARLDDVHASRLGERAGIVAGVVGLPLGVALAIGHGWPRLLHADGGPDWLARIAGLVLASAVALLPVYASALAALSIVLSYKAVGILAVVGFAALVSRLENGLGLRG